VFSLIKRNPRIAKDKDNTNYLMKKKKKGEWKEYLEEDWEHTKIG